MSTQSIPEPDPHILLPPFLACLSAADVSPQPSPVLFQLLSGILRQRVRVLYDGSSPGASWVPLLCWRQDTAEAVSNLLRGHKFDRHPVSGEVEFPAPPPACFRRRDEETLEASIVLEDLGLQVIYLWCVEGHSVVEGEWRVAELGIFDRDAEARHGWHSTMAAADEAFSSGRQNAPRDEHSDAEDEDEDAYWSRYESTPGRTSTQNRSPAPPTWGPNASRRALTSEEEYYARYGDVRPAMDKDGSSEDHTRTRMPQLHEKPAGEDLGGGQYASRPGQEQPGIVGGKNDQHEAVMEGVLGSLRGGRQLDQPRPTSSSSTSAPVISKLEDGAASLSTSALAVKRHIVDTLRGLGQLASNVGIGMDEFDRVVRTELNLLSAKAD